MSDRRPTPEFEAKLRATSAAPEARPEFVRDLKARLAGQAGISGPVRTFRLRPAWGIAIALVALLLAAVLIAGPQRVAAAVQKLFGYIPGVGLVDQNAPLRVLAASVTLTRDGITLTVTQAVLSSDKTVVIYTLDGVPWSALSHREDVPGCSSWASLRLPDGSTLDLTSGAGGGGRYNLVYPSIASTVNQATLVLPCIAETLPGLAPENWELALSFVPAPPDMTMLPVIDVAPSAVPQSETSLAAPNPLQLLKVVDAGDGYILLGEFRASDALDASLPAGAFWASTDRYKITDAGGREVFYTYPADPSLNMPASQPGAESWAFQIGKGFAAPLTISDAGRFIYPAVPAERQEFQFDAGQDPQPGQTWTLNKDFELNGHTVRLVSIEVARDGYGFSFTSDDRVSGVTVEIAGYATDGGGGGEGPDTGSWSAGLSYSTLPTGELTVVLSDLLLYGDAKSWSLQWSPDSAPAGGSSPLYDLSLAVDRYIPLADGYYLIGHTSWTDGRISSAMPSGWALKAYDDKGQELALEPGDWQAAGLNPAANQWLYRLYGKGFAGPITLRTDRMDVTFAQPVTLGLDLSQYGFDGSDAQLGLTWKTGQIPLDIPGLLANAYWVEYIKQGDMYGLKIGIDADPALQALGFDIPAGATGWHGGGASGSNRDTQTGILYSDVLIDGRITFPLTLSAPGATVSGTWEAGWTPPAADTALGTPVPLQTACLSLEDWKAAAASPAALPEGLGGRLAIYGRIKDDGLPPSVDNYAAFLTPLDGSRKQQLGSGITPGFSRDGLQAAYQSSDGLHLVDLASGQDRLMSGSTSDDNGPVWSPDGRQIAFVRAGEAAIYLVNSDGSGLRRLVEGHEFEQLVGWSPDGARIYYINVSTPDRHLRSVQVSSGAITDLLDLGLDLDSPSLSPDGQWLAFLDKVPGRMSPGIFLVHVDGTQRRLVAQLDTWMVVDPHWSPDGSWLALGVLDTGEFMQKTIPALLNLQSCQVFPLTGIEGTVQGWVP